MPPRIAFLGLGAMGFGMATNLVNHKFPVTGFDVYGPTLSRFEAAGGKSANSPRQTVEGAEFVIFMVATAAQVQQALFEGEDAAVKGLGPNVKVLLCSTGPPEYTPEVRKKIDGLGRTDVEVLDAPVSGGTIRAANGTLTVLAAGPDGTLASCKEILDAMAGDKLSIIPGGLGAGTKVKMVHQVLAGIHICMASEAMGFAAALGLGTEDAFQKLKIGQGSSWMFENRTPHMLSEDKTVHSALNIIVKDIGIVTAGGRSANFPLFLSSATEQVLATGVSAGLGLVDDAALYAVYLPQDPRRVFKLASAASGADAEKELRLVESIMVGVHLTAAVEAMSLGLKVGLQPERLFEICSTAAGSSAMFVQSTPQLISGDWTDARTVDEVIGELTLAIEEGHKIKYPLHLAGTALQLFQSAKMRGFGNDKALAVSRIWDGEHGPLFPRTT